MRKKYRIKKSDEIELVMKKGSSCANRTFILYKYKNNEVENYRIAISAPKKIGNSVIRNKIKRQIRASLQQNDSYLKNGYDYFIIARPDVLKINFTTFTKQIIHILKLADTNKRKPHLEKKKSHLF